MATVQKRGNSYLIKVSNGYDINGKQIIQAKTWKPDDGMTEKQIRKELGRQKVLFEEDCKSGLVTSAIKFQILAEEWFEQYAKINLRDTTYEREKQLTVRVYPAIGHMRIDRIKTRHVQAFIANLLTKEKNMKTGKPLSRKTAIHHLSFISSVFQYAIRMDMLKDNPCRRVVVPKEEQKEKNVYTIEETKQVLKLIDSEPMKYRVFICLAIFGGYRRGELLGLEWKDIDFENCTIQVRRTSKYTKAQGVHTDINMKTRKSKRCIKFPQAIINLLRQYKQFQDKEKLRLGSKWVECDRLFTKWNGLPINPNTPYDWFKDFCERKNIRFCNLHSLRHLNASLLINAGVDVVSVSSALGHSQVSTTMNIYSHIINDAKARCSNALANALDLE